MMCRRARPSTPTTRAWRTIAAPPAGVLGDAGNGAVWTGTSAVFWAGNSPDGPAAGAVYDPAQNSWRLLPKGPLGAREGYSSEWTGKELLLIGGTSGDQIASPAAAAVDPRTGAWRLLPALDAVIGLQATGTVWDGRQVFVWGSRSLCPERGSACTEYRPFFATYDPATDALHSIDLANAPADLDRLNPVAWTGADVLFATSGDRSVAVVRAVPRTGHWTFGPGPRPPKSAISIGDTGARRHDSADRNRGAKRMASLGVAIVREYQRGVVFRLGKIRNVRNPGMRFMIPLVDRMQKVTLRTVTMPIQSQQVITKDNVSIGVAAVAYFRRVDPVKSIVEIENVQSAINQIAQTTVRNVVGRSSLDQVLSQTETLNEAIKQILDMTTERWGVLVQLVELKDIQLPESMQRAMAREAEAEREKRAKIIAAEGEALSVGKLAEAADVIVDHPIALATPQPAGARRDRDRAELDDHLPRAVPRQPALGRAVRRRGTRAPCPGRSGVGRSALGTHTQADDLGGRAEPRRLRRRAALVHVGRGAAPSSTACPAAGSTSRTRP